MSDSVFGGVRFQLAKPVQYCKLEAYAAMTLVCIGSLISSPLSARLIIKTSLIIVTHDSVENLKLETATPHRNVKGEAFETTVLAAESIPTLTFPSVFRSSAPNSISDYILSQLKIGFDVELST